MAETNGDTPEEETMVEIQIPKFKPGVQGNTAKGRFYGEHFDQIRSDLATLGKAETIRKWGMSEAWLYDHFVKGDPNVIRRKARERPARVTAPVSTGAAVRAAEELLGMPAGSVATEALGTPQTPQQTTQQAPGNGHSLLPTWRDEWTPEVQVEWLMTLRDIEVARIEAVKK
jgi:hypothetical protein